MLLLPSSREFGDSDQATVDMILSGLVSIDSRAPNRRYAGRPANKDEPSGRDVDLDLLYSESAADVKRRFAPDLYQAEGEKHGRSTSSIAECGRESQMEASFLARRN